MMQESVLVSASSGASCLIRGSRRRCRTDGHAGFCRFRTSPPDPASPARARSLARSGRRGFVTDAGTDHGGGEEELVALIRGAWAWSGQLLGRRIPLGPIAMQRAESVAPDPAGNDLPVLLREGRLRLVVRVVDVGGDPVTAYAPDTVWVKVAHLLQTFVQELSAPARRNLVDSLAQIFTRYDQLHLAEQLRSIAAQEPTPRLGVGALLHGERCDGAVVRRACCRGCGGWSTGRLALLTSGRTGWLRTPNRMIFEVVGSLRG